MKYVEDDRGIFAALRAAYLSKESESKFESLGDTTREISRFNRFRLTPYDLAGNSSLPDLTQDQNPPRLGHTGSDLAACLYYMEKKKDPALENIFKQVRRLCPGLRDLSLRFLARIEFVLHGL